eukprot:560193-Prymnesium_polylepis.1
MLPECTPGHADTWTRTDRGWSEYCQRAAKPIPTTWRLAVADQLSGGAGGRLPTVRQVLLVHPLLRFLGFRH